MDWPCIIAAAAICAVMLLVLAILLGAWTEKRGKPPEPEPYYGENLWGDEL